MPLSTSPYHDRSILVIEGDTKYLRKLRKKLQRPDKPQTRHGLWDHDHFNRETPALPAGYHAFNALLTTALESAIRNRTPEE